MNDPALFGSSLRQQARVAAESVGRWFAAHAQQQDAGLAWPASDRQPAPATGLENGAAGVGMFLLALAEKTGEPAHQALAIQAGDFILSRYAAGEFNGPDWLAGAAGTGEYMLALHRATGQARFLLGARRAGQYLAGQAHHEGAGVYWKHAPDHPKRYTGKAHGAAGIGEFLLALHEATGELQYLDLAEAAFVWLESQKLPLEPGGVGYRRLASDQFVYHAWCGGSAGVMPFLKRLHQVTGKALYRQRYLQVATGLVNRAEPRPQGESWRREDLADSPQFPAYCFGAGGVVEQLFNAYEASGEPLYLQHALAGASWLAAQARTLPKGRGHYWPMSADSAEFELGWHTGVGSVGRVLLRASAYEPRYRAEAEAAAILLLETAVRSQPQALQWWDRWRVASPAAAPEQFVGWHYGSAGIGMFLLQIDTP
ncbi:hypothetical protein H5407_08115 [Mitsuaria sp. WAJ17]|uniref:lanthionine synthetase LanC family protein n=1 Tax=Mitsuaria sp. WAJ17 TaxID=2761452 RepID=UPI001602D621|nr:lanthionine synthetase LanC family protein [Mitsuaria sp. WAJ17]MBB2485196.1 hypothetical protein [Mitsuaria sp. WAJ17]